MTRIYSQEEIQDVALELLHNCGSNLWLFSGDVGAGKTTLISSICALLGCMPQASSPTYAYINQYFTPDKRVILHADLYRVQHVDQFYELGLDVLLTHNDLTFVEWPDLLYPNLTPGSYHSIMVSSIDLNTRKITYST